MKRILFATDGSQEALAARQFLAALPLPPGTAIRVVSVVPAVAADEAFGWQVLDKVRSPEWIWANRAIEETVPALARAEVEVTSDLLGGDAAHAILAAAQEWNASLVVVGSRGLTGLDAFLLGSVARNVAHHAACPVLVARALRNALRQVILAVDGSVSANEAVAATLRLPLPPETEITAVHVARPPRPYLGLVPTDPEHLERLQAQQRRERHDAGMEILEAARRRLQTGGRVVHVALREGDPAQEILELAREQGADLLVAGARGHSLVRDLVLGSVADRLLGHAPCSVLLAGRPPRGEASA